MKQEIAALQASKKKEFSYFVKFDAKWQTAATSVPVGAKTSFSHMKISLGFYFALLL